MAMGTLKGAAAGIAQVQHHNKSRLSVSRMRNDHLSVPTGIGSQIND